MKIALALALTLSSGCALYRAAWHLDEPCLPVCVSRLDLPPISVAATRESDGTCRCEALDPDRGR